MDASRTDMRTEPRSDPAGPRPSAAFRRAVRLILGSSLIAALLLSAIIGVAAYADFRFHVQIMRENLSQAAALTAWAVNHQLSGFGARLEATADLIRRYGTQGPALRSALADQWIAAPGVGPLALLDGTGRVTLVLRDDWFAGERIEVGQDRSGRSDIRIHSGMHPSRPDRDVHLGPPIPNAPPDLFTVPASRAVRSPADGALQAVIEAGLDPNFFRSLLQGREARRGQALLVHADGTILAADPHNSGWIGQSLSDPPLHLDIRHPVPEIVRLPRRSDRPAELAASHPLQSWPLTVVVLRPRSEALVGAIQGLQQDALLLALVLLGIGLVGWHQRRQAARLMAQAGSLQSSHEALQASEDRLHLALDAVGAAVWDWSGESDSFTITDQHRRMIGVGQDFPNSRQAWLARVHPDDRIALERSAAALTAGRSDIHTAEYRIRHENGSWRWLLSRGRARRDPEGRLVRLIGLDFDLTERKAAEESRLQSERRFRAIFEQAGVGIGLFEASGRQIDVNDRFCEIVGYDRDYVLSHSFIDLTHRDDKAMSRDHVERALRGDFSSYALEKRYVRRDGRDVWVAVTVTLLRKPDGSPDYFLGIVEDVDERKRAEQALIKAYRSLSVLSTCNEALVRAGNEQELLADISRLIVNIGGYRFACVATRDDAGSLRTQAMAPSDDSLGVAAFCHANLCCNSELKKPGREGDASPVLIRNLAASPAFASVAEEAERLGCRSVVSLPVKDGYRPFGRLLIVSADEQGFGDDELSLLGQLCSDLAYGLQALRTSEARRQAERAARESENRVRLLLESTAEAIIGVTTEGRITFCNPAALELMDLSPPDTLIGAQIHEGLHVRTNGGKPVAIEQCPICTAISEGRPVHREDLTLPRRSGAATPIEYWSHPVRRNGALSGAVVTFLDISERRMAEDRYRQALKMEAVGQLTGGIAHDFNNLLAVIVGNLELIEERLGDNAALGPLSRQALRAAERGTDLTSRLLAFARREPLKHQRISLNDTLAEATEIMTRTFGDGIELDIQADPGLWPCIADPNQLENALLNLAVNARDAMTAGGTLTVRTANAGVPEARTLAAGTLPPGDYATLSITDTGIGMSPETVARACEPFFTTKGARQGSGLGLSMVFGFVTQAGGQLDIVSREGQGTTVRLYLPRAGAASDALTEGPGESGERKQK